MAEDAMEKLHELVHDIRFAMLTTVDEQGNLHSRPMATLHKPMDGHLWFFTSTDTVKVPEIERDHHVNLSYADPKDQRFVSVAGLAHVEHDHDKMAALWTPALKAFFPDGLESPDLTLLKVQVINVEYWDAPSSAMVRLAGFARAILHKDVYRQGEHQKIDFGNPETSPKFQ